MAVLGYLYLHGGNLNGEQIIPEDWVELTLSPSTNYTHPNQWGDLKNYNYAYSSPYPGSSVRLQKDGGEHYTPTPPLGEDWTQPHPEHAVENSALYRLQAVTNIGNGAGGNNRERVGEKRFAQLIGDGHIENFPRERTVVS